MAYMLCHNLSFYMLYLGGPFISRKPTYEELEKKVKELEKGTLEGKKAEEALRESEFQKKAILEASVDRIRLVDTDMKIIWANKTTTREFNMVPEDLVGQA
jgi:PAS domain-containing protein